MASHYGMIVPVNSQHADKKGLTVRPPEDDLTAARAVLTERRLDMRGFITACLRALADDPSAMLARLAPYWPPEKPRGRPRPPVKN